MVEKIPDLPDNVLGFTAKGTVTAKDYESVIIPEVEAIPGHVRVFHNREYTEATRWISE